MVSMTIKFPHIKGFDPSLFSGQYPKMVGTTSSLTCEYGTEGKRRNKMQVIKLSCSKITSNRDQIKSSFQVLIERETQQKGVEISLSITNR